VKLDIGCGKNKVDGAIGIDVNKNSDADVICDIEKGLPFKDSIFDGVYCNQIIEHVSDLIRFMEEIHRISKNHAKIFIDAPYYASFTAHQDPTHKTFITEYTFDYFIENSPYKYYTKTRFKILTISYKYSKIAKILFFVPKRILRRFLFNSTLGIYFELEVVK